MAIAGNRPQSVRSRRLGERRVRSFLVSRAPGIGAGADVRAIPWLRAVAIGIFFLIRRDRDHEVPTIFEATARSQCLPFACAFACVHVCPKSAALPCVSGKPSGRTVIVVADLSSV